MCQRVRAAANGRGTTARVCVCICLGIQTHDLHMALKP